MHLRISTSSNVVEITVSSISNCMLYVQVEASFCKVVTSCSQTILLGYTAQARLVRQKVVKETLKTLLSRIQQVLSGTARGKIPHLVTFPAQFMLCAKTLT